MIFHNHIIFFVYFPFKMVIKTQFVQIFTWIQHGKFYHDLHKLKILHKKMAQIYQKFWEVSTCLWKFSKNYIYSIFMFRMYPNNFKDDCHLEYITQPLKKTLIRISQLEQEKKSTMFEHLLNYYNQVYKLLYSHVIYYYSHIAIWLWSLVIVITTRKWLGKCYSILYYMIRNGH
jgi:hypothetical protein